MHRCVRFLLAGSACALVGLMPTAPAPHASPPSAELAAGLDAWSRPLTERGLLSGNLLVARRGGILIERAWGMADREAGLPNAPDVPSCVASVTKPMTLMLAIQLMEEGKLALDDPLSKWIPDFPLGDSITVEHLLRHRAGIPHRVTSDDDERMPQTAASMVERAKRATLTHRPGERSSYSSAGFSVLARVLELAGAAPYGDLLRTRLLEPLGMEHSFHPDAGASERRRAASYVPVHGGVESAPFQDYSFLVGAGSVFSTARDIHRLLWAAASGGLGDGVRLSTLQGGTISWNGSTNGFRAFAEYDSTTGNAIVFTGNLHVGAIDALKEAVKTLLAGGTPDPPPLPPARAVKVPATRLASYEGLYQVAGNRLPVRATPTGLDVNGWALVATGDSTFFSLRDFATVKVRGTRSGVERLDWIYGGRPLPCPRLGDLGSAD